MLTEPDTSPVKRVSSALDFLTTTDLSISNESAYLPCVINFRIADNLLKKHHVKVKELVAEDVQLG